VLSPLYCIRLLSLYVHRETSALVSEIPEEPDQFRFLRADCLRSRTRHHIFVVVRVKKKNVVVVVKGHTDLNFVKASVMRVSIHLDLSTRSFILLPGFLRRRIAKIYSFGVIGWTIDDDAGVAPRPGDNVLLKK